MKASALQHNNQTSWTQHGPAAPQAGTAAKGNAHNAHGTTPDDARHGAMAWAGDMARGSTADHVGTGTVDCIVAPAPDTTVYSEEDITGLLFMIEEEKMAGDLYEALYEQTGILAFSNIAAAEDRHMATLLDQAAAMGVETDGLLALPAGDYVNDELDALYLALLEQGSQSDSNALEVGVLVEETDIADLQIASIGLVGTPLGSAYEHLLDGSNSHLAAFEGLLIG